MTNRRKFNQENVREAMRIYVDIAYQGWPQMHRLESDLLDGHAEAAVRETEESNWDKFEYRIGLPGSGHAKFIGYVRNSLFGKKMRVCVNPNYDGGETEEQKIILGECARRIERAWQEAGFDVV